jgi:pilus assembly protein Flp/PilA
VAARFALNDKGATAIEYGLLVALIAVVIIAAMTAISGTIQTNFYEKVQNSMEA